jgi:hypothetical protein
LQARPADMDGISLRRLRSGEPHNHTMTVAAPSAAA